MYKVFIEIDLIGYNLIQAEFYDWNHLILIGIIQFEEENFSCLNTNEKIHKCIYLEKEIYFQVYLLAKEKQVSVESLIGDLALNSYLFLLNNG